jgi:hypothetical protein
MKAPKKFNQQEFVVEPFVIAADTNTLDSACDLLFINGSDLTWGEQGFGLFLVDVSTDENFEEVTEVVEARSKLSFSSILDPVLRKLEPRFVEILANVAPELEKQTDFSEREKVIGRAVATEFTDKKTRAEFDKLAPEVFGLNQWMSLADLVASSLLRGAISLRARQMASTGKSEDDYANMLYGLERFDLCDPMVRIAYPPDSLNLEMAVATQGEFRATAIMEGANMVEWLRLKPDLASLKLGQETALPLFIAAYINKHYPGPQQAFACARYGQENEAELDVVIPALDLGFEIKLYQAPFSMTNNKLANPVSDLRQQLPSYVKAGCARLCYVCNLTQETAESVARMAQDGSDVAVAVVPIGGGIGELLPVLDEIVQQLEFVRQGVFEQKVQKRVAAAANKGPGTP